MDANDPRHGSSAGYYAHKRAGQKPCDGCRQGMRDYELAYKAGRRFGDERTYDHVADAVDVELTGGRWVNHRGIMRWHPDGMTA
jgi:hypothetical protein